MSARAVDVRTDVATIHAEVRGDGPPVLLLHGMPQTLRMWDGVAERLAASHTIVAADLRGHGASSAPDPATVDCSMRGLARDQLELMRALGFDRFAVAGHDRGARCAHRLAVDAPDAVTRLAVLDVVPTGDAFEAADDRFALGFWVWSFLAAEGIAERLVSAEPDAFVDHLLADWAGAGFRFAPEAREAYRAQLRDPARVASVCAQYRAAATVDRERDLADRAQTAIAAPVLVLWSAQGALAEWYDPLEVWRRWAHDVRGGALDCGHFLPEERPEETAGRLLEFLASQSEG